MAAMTILREHEELAADQSCFPIWVHSAFCVTAVVVLCLNILHAQDRTLVDPRAAQQQLDRVQNARERLLKQKSDTMARRGVHLIDALLANESAHFCATQSLASPAMSPPGSASSLDFDGIVARFFELDRDRPQHANDYAQSSEVDTLWDLPENFDLWFGSTFGAH
ncbi:hypothetical protein LTR85_005528 [Meristemomyces frigidus]|nr:hypothetical protein LTR85_005528 [Meristemomyces frigidus]